MKGVFVRRAHGRESLFIEIAVAQRYLSVQSCDLRIDRFKHQACNRVQQSLLESARNGNISPESRYPIQLCSWGTHRDHLVLPLIECLC